MAVNFHPHFGRVEKERGNEIQAGVGGGGGGFWDKTDHPGQLGGEEGLERSFADFAGFFGSLCRVFADFAGSCAHSLSPGSTRLLFGIQELSDFQGDGHGSGDRRAGCTLSAALRTPVQETSYHRDDALRNAYLG